MSVDGFVNYLIRVSGQQYSETLTAVADEYLFEVGQLRTKDIALLKSFEPYRGWAIVEAGYYDEVILPNGLRQRIPKSISFANMDEDTFQSLYKAVFNVLWNSILHRSFRTQQEAEGVALRAMAGKLGISHNQVSVRLQTAEGFIDGCLAALGVALEMDLCVQHEPVVMQLTGTRE
ncbi:DUF1367 family protein [Yersinia wautersii]|uniref:DUF1367 family protein n=1 Tax=Yersinia wautersii TaxID=1341643 RepID=UPI0021B1796D|nr:DUF1367 family protein [Yersinia wautersii]